jgi:hypothetical protein
MMALSYSGMADCFQLRGGAVLVYRLESVC